MVNNLSESKNTPDRIKALFGAWGNVERVKIAFKKRSTAFVQFEDHQQAVVCMNYMEGQMLFGKRIRINPARMHEIKAPQANDSEESKKLTKLYHRDPKRWHNRNIHQIVPPSERLHIKGFPEGVCFSRNLILSLFIFMFGILA